MMRELAIALALDLLVAWLRYLWNRATGGLGEWAYGVVVR